MNRTAWWVLVGWLALGLCLGLLAGELMVNHAPVAVPMGTGLVLGILAAVLAAVGWQVRRMKVGRPAKMSALGAARVLVLAFACSRGGSVLTGFFGALALVYLKVGGSGFVNAQLWALTVAAVASLVLAGVGLLVEHWCHVDDGGADGGAGAPAPVG